MLRAAELGADSAGANDVTVPYPFSSGDTLLAQCREHGLEIHELVAANERAFRPPAETEQALLRSWGVMQACVERGFRASGNLPGSLKVRRRAPKLYRTLSESREIRPLDVMDWVDAVGVACSMAAGGLVAALNGSNGHVENAAEIGMEHNLGLTCDPVAGLVQIPCIERNAMGAIKAINAARLAMRGDGTHKVSLDHVIATMRQTGLDMSAIYKETSEGGLAVNVPEC